MKRKTFVFVGLALAMIVFFLGINPGQAATAQEKIKTAAATQKPAYRFTPEMRKAAALRFKKQLTTYFAKIDKLTPQPEAMDPGGVPHYWGPIGNYANSPMPRGGIAAITLNYGGSDYVAPAVSIVDLLGTGHGATANAIVVGGVITLIQLTNPGTNYTAPAVLITDSAGVDADATATIGGVLAGGIRKFIDRLPGLNSGNANLLGQYIPVAKPDKSAYSGSDYYEIELGQYSEKLHTDLPPTTFRGYRQTNTSDPTVSQFHYLGPLIIATKDRPVRIKFTNSLPINSGGNLFIPVDTTVMGAGMGPVMGEMYTQNRAELHLHGGATPWISDGTPHQWTTPAGESTPYPKGVSVVNVPDMPAPGDGSMTFYYTNQQSARLMFYHDHAVRHHAPQCLCRRSRRLPADRPGGAGPDQRHQQYRGQPRAGQILPDAGIPLIIQDKSFVDAATIAAQDPTWNWGTTPPTPNTGDLWMPHVYMPNQNPYDIAGASAFGRWQYGPWFWPPTTDITYGPIDNPYAADRSLGDGQDPRDPQPVHGHGSFHGHAAGQRHSLSLHGSGTPGLPLPHPERRQRPVLQPAALRRRSGGRECRWTAQYRSQDGARRGHTGLSQALAHGRQGRRRARPGHPGSELDPDRHRGRVLARARDRPHPARHLGHEPDGLRHSATSRTIRSCSDRPSGPT